MYIGLICIMGKIIYAIIYKIFVWYLLFSIVQMMIAITYFLLSYKPQIYKIDYRKLLYNLRRKMMIKIIGEYAFNIMDDEKNNRN